MEKQACMFWSYSELQTRMNAAKEEIEIDVTKTYRCLESQKTSAGAAKERTHNRKNKWMRNT